MPILEQAEQRIVGYFIRCDLCGCNSDVVDFGEPITDDNRKDLTAKLVEKAGFTSPIVNESVRYFCPGCVGVLKQAVEAK